MIEMGSDMKRLCRMSYTIMSAVWLGGPHTAEAKAALARKRQADKRAVDSIMAGMPDPAVVLSREAFASLADEDLIIQDITGSVN